MATALLMPRDIKADGGIIEFVEERQHHPARVAKDNLDTLFEKRIDNDLRT
jgi:hypothetical protein